MKFSSPAIPRATVGERPTESNLPLVKTIRYNLRGYTGYYYGSGRSKSIVYVYDKFTWQPGDLVVKCA
jgi:hypothetical protein